MCLDIRLPAATTHFTVEMEKLQTIAFNKTCVYIWLGTETNT